VRQIELPPTNAKIPPPPRAAWPPPKPRPATPPGCERFHDCFLQQAVAGLSIGLILIDPRGVVVWLNRAAEQLLGLPARECVGRDFCELALDPQLAAFWTEVACRSGNCMGDISVHWPHALELKLNATQCLGQDGAVIGRALLFCDVTTERSVKVELTQEIAHKLLDLATHPNEPPAPVASLTPRELRTLRLVGRGLDNERIAEQLHVAPSTVRSHLKSAYRKLKLRSRTAAVRFAVQHGLT
jgi:DNA-binding CsgD family transcriptional regulator